MPSPPNIFYPLNPSQSRIIATPLGKRCAMDAIRALQNQTVYGVRLQCTLSNTTTILPKRRPIPGPYGSLGKLPRFFSFQGILFTKKANASMFSPTL